MKILKSIFILILFTNLVVSCTDDDIIEVHETNAIENIQASGGDGEEVDQTKKG